MIVAIVVVNNLMVLITNKPMLMVNYDEYCCECFQSRHHPLNQTHLRCFADLL